MMVLKCINCGKTFTTYRNAQKYCSIDCRKQYSAKSSKGDIKELTCAHCGETFVTLQKRKYCTKYCRRQSYNMAKKKPTPVALSAEAISKLANAEGLSYGKYVAKYNL